MSAILVTLSNIHVILKKKYCGWFRLSRYEGLDSEGVVNEDLPNSWECLKCCNEGKQGQLKVSMDFMIYNVTKFWVNFVP